MTVIPTADVVSGLRWPEPSAEDIDRRNERYVGAWARATGEVTTAAPRRLSRIRCMDCNRDTGARGLKEYPLMLRDDVWLSITADTDGAGVLCRADIERRLGRELMAADMMGV